MKSFIFSLVLYLVFLVSGLVSAAPIAVRKLEPVKSQPEKRLEKRSLQDSLFPSSLTYASGFTTAEDVDVDGVTKVDLSDSALNVFQVQSGMTHNVVDINGKTAWEAVYAEGSWNPSNEPLGGFGFYVSGSDDFKDAAGDADELVVGYSVMFQDGFEFNKGGKLPGGFGGIGDSAFGCSGGRQDDRDKCFDARLMWRTDGAGEVYTYLPLTSTNEKAQLAVPGTVGNPEYGISVGRGAFSFAPGEWVTVSERIKLNDVGQNNGEIRLFVNGDEAITLTGVSLRSSDSSVFQGMHFQTFFGGSTSDWASPKTQKAYFADVSGAVVKS